MKRTLLFFLKYFIFWYGYFVFFRILFLMFNIGQTVTLSGSDLVKTFLYGSRMDLSAAGYLTGIPGVLLILTFLIKPGSVAKIIRWYTFILLIVNSFLGSLDWALYPAWGTRLNAQIIPYLSHPAEMANCLTIWQLMAFLLICAGVVWFSDWIYRKWFDQHFKDTPKAHWAIAPVMMLLTGALILPIRSGINTSPLNFSSVYFSKKLYANHSAYNFFWSFNYALLHRELTKNPVPYFDKTTCQNNLKGVDTWDQETVPCHLKSPDGKQINVIMIIVESFSSNVVGRQGGTPGITPCFDKLCDDGILFSSFYATGNRSDKGLSALLGGYPALIKAVSLLQYPEKIKTVKFLPAYMGDLGYDLSFHYGGDIDFFNTSMFLTQSGVTKQISNKNFPMKLSTMQKWGVPDQYLYDRLLKDLPAMKRPFFSMLYTISSHEPFDVPYPEHFKDKYENGVSYADWCLGNFMKKLKASPYWKNTLVIITGDHGAMYGKRYTSEDPAAFHTPMLWTGGVVDTTFTCRNICMQTDLGPTLIQQLGHRPAPSYFSKNMFGKHQFAIYLRDEGFGFLSPEVGFYRNFESGKQTFFYGKDNTAKDSLDRFSKSFVEYLHEDFLKR